MDDIRPKSDSISVNPSNSSNELIPGGLLEDAPDLLRQLGDLLDASGRVDLLEDGVQLATRLIDLAEALPHVLQYISIVLE